MKIETKKIGQFILAGILVWIIVNLFSSVIGCKKEVDVQPSQDSALSMSRSIQLPLNANITTWERYLYVDSTQGIYKNTAEKAKLLKYAKKYGFTGFYFYDLSSILGSSSNDGNMSSFLKQCADSGIVIRSAVSGSSSSFVTGRVKRYQGTQTDPKKKFTRYNYENEWWNGATTFSNWISEMGQIANTGADNDFYQGWYKNLGSTPDTIASKLQLLNTDRILHHVYVNGYPTYNYANASGRLDVIAKGQRQIDSTKQASVVFIASAEKKSIGAANDFSGAVLAANATKANPFYEVEKVFIADLNSHMTAFQKKYIKVVGIIWFDRKWVYRCVTPTP